MKFSTYLIRQTGLSLYDFRVLDLGGTSERDVREMFNSWLEACTPAPQYVNEAIEAAADEGFEIFAA